MTSIDDDHYEAPPKPNLRFAFCFDYGTTYTGVAWALPAGGTPTLEDIHVIDTWGGKMAPKVPSLMTFAANKGSLWGYDIGDTPYVVRLSKLQLEALRRADALAALKSTLDEARLLNFGPQHAPHRKRFPRHLTKSPADVVTSYLIKVAEQVRRVIEQEKDKRILTMFPMDLIITHPAEWDYKARNRTFRAVNEAFRQAFPESLARDGVIRLATEPEACAQFTMRYAQDQGISNLRKNHCFICVDAGGGTVDLVSYIVDEVQPFRVRKITPVSGARYGATRIDDSFLYDFLPRRLGGLQRHIGPAKRSSSPHVVLTKHQQFLLERFQDIKHNFSGRPLSDEADTDYPLELPTGIGLPTANARLGIVDENLLISSADLEEMFRVSVEGTLELIEKQLTLVERQGGRVTTVFISGGLSQSPYLYKCVEELTQGWDFKLVRAPESWSAVAPGGVLMGLGVGCDLPPPCIPCPYHIGVVLAERWNDYSGLAPSQKYEDTFDNQPRVKDNIKWLVAKGDLVTEDEGIEISQPVIRKFSRNGHRTGLITIVLSSFEGFSEPPTQLSNTLDNQRQTRELEFDLTDTPMSLTTHPGTNSTYHKVEMHLEISINQIGANIELVAGRTRDMLGQTGAAGLRLAHDYISFD